MHVLIDNTGLWAICQIPSTTFRSCSDSAVGNTDAMSERRPVESKPQPILPTSTDA